MKNILNIVVVLVIVGCSFAPQYERPKMALPDSFGYANGRDNAVSSQWWKHFDSEILNVFVEEALMHNRDIMAAAARTEQAAAMLGTAKSALFPSVDGTVQISENWVKGDKVQGGTPPFSAGLNASWQIDLFGKYRNATESAKAQLLASHAAWEGVMLSVIGQTVSGFYLLKSLDLQLNIAKETVASREKSVTIYEQRYEAGLISQLDLAQMKSSLETARSSYFKVKISRDKADAALMLLLGRSPADIMETSIASGIDLEQVFIQPVIPSGLPSKLLERRPDIKSAEQSIISANADIGTAKAMWFPDISLTGMFGIVSNELDRLFTDPKLAWSYGASANIPLINFGRVSSGVRQAEARKKEAVINYEKTVQQAFADLRNALISQSELQNVVKSLDVMRGELRRAYDIVTLQYDRGYVSYIDVLDTERTLFQTEMELASARSDYITAVVNVCMALGGGWYDGFEDGD